MHLVDLKSLSLIILLACVVGDLVEASSCKKRWCKYSVTSCISHTLALTQWNTPNLHQCMLKASSSSVVDDPVTQWNKQTGVCSIFYYQQVCPYLHTSPALSEQCSVYRLSALVSCDASLLNPRFLGVWLAGGSSRLGNLVCQSDPNNYRMVSGNIAWSDEGAVFNGVSSYALVNDSRMMANDTSAGFTWLMRLKRQPQIQTFMELTTCNLGIGRHFWEHNVANRMLYSKAGWNGDAFNFMIISDYNALPNNNSTWVNIGISVGATANRLTFFIRQNFVNHTVLTSQNSGATAYCFLSIGKRWSSSSNLLKGVVRAVAVANGSMTELDIRNFFALIP